MSRHRLAVLSASVVLTLAVACEGDIETPEVEGKEGIEPEEGAGEEEEGGD